MKIIFLIETAGLYFFGQESPDMTEEEKKFLRDIKVINDLYLIV